jgi:hypothetical protein
MAKGLGRSARPRGTLTKMPAPSCMTGRVDCAGRGAPGGRVVRGMRGPGRELWRQATESQRGYAHAACSGRCWSSSGRATAGRLGAARTDGARTRVLADSGAEAKAKAGSRQKGRRDAEGTRALESERKAGVGAPVASMWTHRAAANPSFSKNAGAGEVAGVLGAGCEGGRTTVGRVNGIPPQRPAFMRCARRGCAGARG